MGLQALMTVVLKYDFCVLLTASQAVTRFMELVRIKFSFILNES